jgi:putative transposase
MDEMESLSHTKWECKYHVVFIPKGRRKTLYGELRQHWGEVLGKLAVQKESRIEEGHLLPDHVHMMIAIPPKYAVSQVVGFIKGKSAIHLARVCGERKRNFVGQHFWARGYYVSTVGREETVIRDYHAEPGARGQTLGPDEPVALIGHRQARSRGYPPPPWSSGMSRFRGKSRKIFDVKELIGKIFRTKDLASAASVLWGHARRVSFAYQA